MASIVYAMSGEGRGHATRARVVVEALRARHRVTLFASDCAYAMLEARYRGTDVHMHRIPGLGFAYGGPGRVSLFGTLGLATRFRMSLEGYVTEVMPEVERCRPDLVIADFEPILPRAARRARVPFVSFDHQHYLVAGDHSELPFGLRQQARAAAPFVRALYDWQRATIVSSFYTTALRPAYRNTTWVGTLLRPEILETRPARGSHLLAYIRRHAPARTLAALAASGRRVRVYGLGARASEGSLSFHAVDERRFLDDLADCAALVSTAGNQLMGEALHFGKPVLVMPEVRNFEQAVNAHFLERSGAGWSVRGELTNERIGAFLEAAPSLRPSISPESVCGNAAAIAALDAQLGAGPLLVPRPRQPAVEGRRARAVTAGLA